MSYAGTRRIIDVDSHVIELDDFLHAAATQAERTFLPLMDAQSDLPVEAAAMARGRELHASRNTDPAVMARFDAAVLDHTKNGWSRLGAWDPRERSHALDLFGYEYQLVLPTLSFHQIAHQSDPQVLEIGSRVLNRALGQFCAHDPRLMAIGYVPLTLGQEKAGELLDAAFADGCYSVMVDTNEPDPTKRSFTHPDFDPVWARFSSADVPFVVHVAANGDYEPVSPSFDNNDRRIPKFAGDAPGQPLGFISLQNSAQLFLSAMILDEVFERHDGLRCISMEHGAYWVPSWLQGLDFTANTLLRVSPRTRRASEVARERIRFSPFPGEPIGWIIDAIGPDMLVYASDYPHPEGSGNPIAKFEATMPGCDERAMRAFFFDNAAAFLRLPIRRA